MGRKTSWGRLLCADRSGAETLNHGFKERSASNAKRVDSFVYSFCVTMQEMGFEPTQYCYHTDLNRARLPFRHSCEQIIFYLLCQLLSIVFLDYTVK